MGDTTLRWMNLCNMTSNLLQSIETKEQLHNVLAAINEAFPNQAPIESELGKYTAYGLEGTGDSETAATMVQQRATFVYGVTG